MAARDVLVPCDANQTARLVAAMTDRPGVVYLRTTRGATPVIYGPDEAFEIGGSRVIRASASDDVAIVAAGIAVHEAIAASDALAASGLRARVIDLYSVKPIDGATLAAAAREVGRIATVEDHRPEGGVGEAVLSSLAEAAAEARVSVLAVRHMPGSATPDEQLADAGIDRTAIAEACRRLCAPA